MQIGIVGLGKMGASFALNAQKHGIEAIGISKPPISDRLKDSKVQLIDNYKDLVARLMPPRKIIISVPAGPAIDLVINDLVQYLEKGDVIIDCGNSYYKDSVIRQRRLAEKGIDFVDSGSSGGPSGALEGACFMVGGTKEAVDKVAPILTQFAVPDGFLHAGPPGAGHFVKLVHNAIEFGMLQAIGEGVSLLKMGDYNINLIDVFHNWAHGSVIRGWLVELMEKGLRDGLNLDEIDPYIEDTGEVNWIVEEAVCREIPIPNISQAVWALMKTRDKNKYAEKTVSLLRHEFGGHPIGPYEGLKIERETGKVVQGTCKADTGEKSR